MSKESLTWLIHDGKETASFWSNEHGWTSLEEATRFTDEEHDAFVHLPIGGEWLGCTPAMLNRSMNQHTPGPWYSYCQFVMVRKPEREYLGEGAPETICEMQSSVSPQETTANQRLIVAAPEMLAMLRNFVMALSENPRTDIEYEYEIEQARALIARATGGAA